jgi:hypothetical protein
MKIAIMQAIDTSTLETCFETLKTFCNANTSSLFPPVLPLKLELSWHHVTIYHCLTLVTAPRRDHWRSKETNCSYWFIVCLPFHVGLKRRSNGASD